MFENARKEFLKFISDNSLNIESRLSLAQDINTDPKILALLAFDKGHFDFPGDIRISVALNPSTPPKTLIMISENSDRLDWAWDDWLDYENDDWSDEVDYPAEFGADISSDIIIQSGEAALRNPNYPNQ